ncbi:unnamed protein product [Lampetra fluviatilis]
MLSGRSGSSPPSGKGLRAAHSCLAELFHAMQQKVAIYGPPSNTRHRFATRRRGDTETPLAFRSALLALAKATYPRRDEEGSDALGMEKHGSCW